MTREDSVAKPSRGNSWDLLRMMLFARRGSPIEFVICEMGEQT
jgi:hypothetical protein